MFVTLIKFYVFGTETQTCLRAGQCLNFFIPMIFFILIRDLNMGKNRDSMMCFMLILSFNVYT